MLIVVFLNCPPSLGLCRRRLKSSFTFYVKGLDGRQRPTHDQWTNADCCILIFPPSQVSSLVVWCRRFRLTFVFVRHRCFRSTLSFAVTNADCCITSPPKSICRRRHRCRRHRRHCSSSLFVVIVVHRRRCSSSSFVVVVRRCHCSSLSLFVVVVVRHCRCSLSSLFVVVFVCRHRCSSSSLFVFVVVRCRRCLSSSLFVVSSAVRSGKVGVSK